MDNRGFYKSVKCFNYASTYSNGDYYVVNFQPDAVVKPHPTFENVYKIYDSAYMWANNPDEGKRDYVKGALTADLGVDFVENSQFFEKITEEEANEIFDEKQWVRGTEQNESE